MGAVTIRGLEPVLSARLAGKLPAREVLLWCDKEPAKWSRYADAVGMPEGRVTEKDDMRVLLRLDVILVADRFTAKTAAILEKVKGFARSVVFVALELEDGTVWDRENEERTL